MTAKSVLALTACLLAAAGGAQEPPLTWERAVSVALANNPELASAGFDEEANRSDYLSSFNGLLPKLDLTHSYNDSLSSTGKTRWQAQAGATLNLWSPSTLAAIGSTGAALELSRAKRRQASAELRFDLRQAFAQTLYYQQTLRTAERIVEIRRRNAGLVGMRHESGRESLGNKLRADAQRLSADADLAQASRDLRAAQTAFSRRLGLVSAGVMATTGTLRAAASPPQPALGAEGLLGLRPDLAVQSAEVDVSQAGVKLARSSLWPSLTASYRRSVVDRLEFPSGQSDWSFATVLSLPLFGGGPTGTFHDVAAAKARLARSKEDLRAAQAAAREDLEASRAAFAKAADQVEVRAALLEAARQRNDEADVRYGSGLLTYDDWELIVSDRVSAESAVLRAGYEEAIAEAAWAKATGNVLGE